MPDDRQQPPIVDIRGQTFAGALSQAAIVHEPQSTTTVSSFRPPSVPGATQQEQSSIPPSGHHTYPVAQHGANIGSPKPSHISGQAVPITPDSAKRKRASNASEDRAATEPLNKRPRVRARPLYELDGLSFLGGTSSFDHTHDNALPSPLFFSHSPRQRPQIPPRFSSGEAGATMLSKARIEDSHIKTVSLARGTISTPSAPTSAPATSASAIRRSLERTSTARSHSPESSSGRDAIGINANAHLNSIGIIELLEQDERPTFIVDLSDSSNYGPGSLHPIFTNLSIRAADGLLDTINASPPEGGSPDAINHIQFKSWLLSATINGESLNVCLPPFAFAGLSWSCSTLRKRLRIISGTFFRAAQTRATPLDLDSRPASNTLTPALPSVGSARAEQSDYFGRSPVLEANGSAESTSHPDVRSSIEPPKLRSPRKSDDSVMQSSPMLPSISAQISPNLQDFIEYTNNEMDLPLTELPSFDWTQIPISDSMSEHIQFARSIDWSQTALGPIESWGPDLRQMCNLIMASPHPAAMYWGDDFIAIYNEAYVLLAGQKHPVLMGMSYRLAWQEIWDDVKGVFDNARSTGEATMKDDDCLFIRRNNYLEETYFSWSIIPMLGDDGSVMGLYNPAFEKTRRKIAERRMLTLREVGEKTASARDVKSFWSKVLSSFDFNEYDSPFLLLYSVSDESDSDSASLASATGSTIAPRYCTLEGALGVPDNHPAAPNHFELKSGDEGFAPAFREVLRSMKPALLEVESGDLDERLVKDLHIRGFGDPIRAAVVCPIHPTTGESTLGFLVLGVNPRRPYDDDYSLFVQLLSRQLATSLASVVLFEEEIKRGQRAARLAALDRIELSEQLAARTKEAIESEIKFTRMAEFAPVGMFVADTEGTVIFANDAWYELSGVERGSEVAEQWAHAIKEEDQPLVEDLRKKLVQDLQPVSGEFRYRSQWRDRNGDLNHTWVLFSAFPEKHDDGSLKSVFGTVTNISQQKWAEGLQTRKMQEAIELKRQQENFIDITSHEMRNPLSAILQCADEITTCLTEIKQNSDKHVSDETITNVMEAAQTISLCSQHQKRIVDDILTLSKLDSQLLLVTPVDAQPLTVVQRALKMHEGELSAADIQLRFVVDQSFKDLDLDWLRFDPSRVLQVLINLTTNAIKFTTTESKRTITVSIAASKERPSGMVNAPVKYFPTRSKRPSFTSEGDWGDGEQIYVHFAVKDTGRGLNTEEKKMLFIRFSQASPRTHVQYGGSGLGLFISRELTELQGGEIGVASEAGQGSVFAFYIAARRSTAPAENDAAKAMVQRFAVEPQKKTSAQSRSNSTTDGAAPIQRKVLIVEDNLVNQRVLQKQLKNLGTEVHLANHGGEAIERLMQSTYWAGPEHTGKKIELGVVLMDQEMPVMDGLTCTKKIRELEQEGKLTGHIPIIAVTANARQEQIQTALDAGMDDVVSKPFRIPDLMPKIDELQQRYPMPAAR